MLFKVLIQLTLPFVALLFLANCDRSSNDSVKIQQTNVGKAAFRSEYARLSNNSITVMIVPGGIPEAIQYYQRISQKLSIPLLDSNGNVLPNADLDALIVYAGYEGLRAKDLESIESFLLMPTDDETFSTLSARVADPTTFKSRRKLVDFGNDNLLVSRFFAPKIVDYTQIEAATDNLHYAPGWRKLAKLKPLPNSAASIAGVDSIYILFNFVKQDVTSDPYVGNSSKNNQVIIIPKSFQKGTEDSAFFLVYGEAPANQLVSALGNVAFDLPGPRDYFVPNSCAQCHGHDSNNGIGGPAPADGIYRQARLNYLDTDQWHDAMAFDFPQLSSAPWGILFDGGRNVATPDYRTAMEVMRKLNAGALTQNATVDGTDFKFQAAEKWVQLHAGQDAPVEFIDRAIGSTHWNSTNADEKELLSLLNHYCFRCHSSIRFNIFDKNGVDLSSAGFKSRLNALTNSGRYMPQGRILPQATKDRIVELTEKVFP